jgi:hypothetical protein
MENKCGTTGPRPSRFLLPLGLSEAWRQTGGVHRAVLCITVKTRFLGTPLFPPFKTRALNETGVAAPAA